MKKRTVAAALTAAMMMGTMATTAVQAEEMVTVSLYIPTLANYSEDAIVQVQDAMNVLLAEKYGIQVELQYTEIGNFEQVINLAMTTDELDVTCFFTENGGLGKYVNNGQLLDITEMYADATEEFKATFTEEEIIALTRNGSLWGVPRKYQYGGKGVVVMNAAMVEEMGIDPSTVDSMDALGEVLYQVKEKYPEVIPLVPQSGAEMTWMGPWDPSVGQAQFLSAENPDSTEIKNIFELDSFAEFCGYTNKWYNDGLIMADALSNTMEGTSLVSAGTAFAVFHNADIDPLEMFYPGTVTSADIFPAAAQCASIGNLAYGISTNSAHPEESFTLLQAIYTDAELATLLGFGIEGEHWAYDENGRAVYPEGVTAENEPYGGFTASATYPNYLLFPVRASATTDDYAATVAEWNANVNVTEFLGWVFDTTEYADFVTAYANLEEKYLNPLETGTIALEDVLPDIQKELEAIGFYEICAEAQAQFDEFNAQ